MVVVALMMTTKTVAQERKITGRLIDEDTKKPVPGVHVVRSDTAVFTETNILGFFELIIDNSKTRTIQISHEGYPPYKIPIPPQDRFTVTIKKMSPTESVDSITLVLNKQLELFMLQNLRYPALAHRAGVEGPVDAEFDTDEDGTISAVRLLNDPGTGCGDEVKRVLFLLSPELLSDLTRHSQKSTFLLTVLYGFDEAKTNRNKPLPETKGYQLQEIKVIATGGERTVRVKKIHR